MVDYRLTEDAKEDLRRIYLYGVQAYGADRAERYYHALFDRFEQIAEQPYMYPSVDFIRKGYRRSVFGSDHIYYRMVDDRVEIVSILGRQDAQTIL